MPTQPPPVPDVFGQFIDPRVAQQNTLDQFQQSQQIQNQSQRFNGWEGGLGKGAGLLTKFIEGASVGRANADAKTAHSEAMKSAQDAQHLNQYIQMVNNDPSLDPDAKQQLAAKAIQHQGQMVDTIMKESDNPLMKVLHPIFQGIMGGEPANESTKKDPKTGKKSKVKTSYQGPDEDAFKGLMSDYFNASQNQTIEKVYPQKSAALIDQAKQAAAGLAHINGQEPDREQVQRAVAPLLSQGDVLAQKYGMRTNPVADWLETYAPKQSADAKLKDALANREIEEQKREDEYSKRGTQTAPPPEPPGASGNLMTRPKEERQQPVFDKLYGEKPQTQAQKDTATPPSKAIDKNTDRMDPAWLAAQVRQGRATQKEETIKVGDTYKKVPITYDFQGTPRDIRGFPIDPDSIGQPVLETKDGKSLGMKYTDAQGKEQVVLGIYQGNGEFKPATILIDGKPVPVKPIGGAGGMDKTLTMINAHTSKLEGMMGAKRTQLEAIANKIKSANPQYQFAMSPEVQAKFDAEVDKAGGPLRDEIKNYQEMIDNNKAILKEHGAEDLANSYNSTLSSTPVPNQQLNQLNSFQ